MKQKYYGIPFNEVRNLLPSLNPDLPQVARADLSRVDTLTIPRFTVFTLLGFDQCKLVRVEALAKVFRVSIIPSPFDKTSPVLEPLYYQTMLLVRRLFPTKYRVTRFKKRDSTFIFRVKRFRGGDDVVNAIEQRRETFRIYCQFVIHELARLV